MLRVHRRHRWLPRVFASLRALGRGRQNTLVVMQDRPTDEVLREVEHGLRFLGNNWGSVITEAPFPLVDDRENYMDALRVHWDVCRRYDPDVQAGSLWDDDMWLSADLRRELRGYLGDFAFDRVEARSYFLWDDTVHANEAFPPHWQAILFRNYPQDNYTDEFVTHCPAYTSRSPYVLRCHARLLNAGYLTETDRREAWEQSRRTGKIDNHTLRLITDPQLVELYGR